MPGPAGVAFSRQALRGLIDRAAPRRYQRVRLCGRAGGASCHRQVRFVLAGAAADGHRSRENHMTDTVTAIRPASRFSENLGRIRRALDGVSYKWLALPLPFAVATIFLNSAIAKLANLVTT